MRSGNDRRKLIQRVEDLIRRERLMERGDRILVACSGGPDSVCLLRVLDVLSRDWDWTLVVGHVDHGIRSSSEQEMRWVAALAERWGMRFVWRRVHVSGHSENAARRARYAALDDMADEVGAAIVALGHHADDQAETVLMRLIRGAGLRGAAGMASRRGRFVRPLLRQTRESILAVLAQEGLDVVQDPSNQDDRFLRNWVRRRVVPLLEERNPNVVETLAAFAHRQRRDLEALDRAMVRLWSGYAMEVHGPEGRLGVRLDLRVSDDLGEGGLWWFVRRAHALVKDALGGEVGRCDDVQLGAVHVEQVLAVSGGFGEKRISLPGGVAAVTAPDFIVVLPESWTEAARTGRWMVPAGVGLTALEHTGWLFDAGPNTMEVVTNWKGARFEDGRKLQDHYVDAKVPRILRSHLPLVVSEGVVEWALGCRSAGHRLFVAVGSLEHALVELFWTGSGRQGIFDLSQPGLSVTTKAREISGGRAFGEAVQSMKPNPGPWNRKA